MTRQLRISTTTIFLAKLVWSLGITWVGYRIKAISRTMSMAVTACQRVNCVKSERIVNRDHSVPYDLPEYHIVYPCHAKESSCTVQQPEPFNMNDISRGSAIAFSARRPHTLLPVPIVRSRQEERVSSTGNCAK